MPVKFDFAGVDECLRYDIPKIHRSQDFYSSVRSFRNGGVSNTSTFDSDA